MEPNIDRPPPSGDFDGQVVGEYVGFLVGHAAGFRRRHVRAVSDRVDVVPFRSERLLIHADAAFRLRKAAIEENLGRPVRRNHD